MEDSLSCYPSLGGDQPFHQVITVIETKEKDQGQSKPFGLVYDFVGIFERLESALAFDEPPKREAFFKFMRNLQSLYEVLSPDAYLRPFLEGYLALQELYGLIRAAQPHPYVDPELTAKTRALLRQHSQTHSLEPPGMIRELGPRNWPLSKLAASTTW